MNKINLQNFCSGSFRDPSGVVFLEEDAAYRKINTCYAQEWDYIASSGFWDYAVANNLVLPFEEAEPADDCYKIIKSPLLPFVSYPYEWSFGQYKAAALHTLDVLDASLRFGLVLKDATAYNIQFIGTKPVFIDHLSFEKYEAGKPWKAYLQFCKHFLAPLALMATKGLSCNRLMECWIDGLPLDLTSALLPFKTKFSLNLGIHIHLHSRLQEKYGDARKAKQKIDEINLKNESIQKLSASLRYAINSLSLPSAIKTEWGDYYNDTNYTETAQKAKMDILEKIASENPHKALAVDLGANQGNYSQFLSRYYDTVLALDIDYIAVEKFYQRLVKDNNSKIIPLVFDLGNPSPNIGWANTERMTFSQRCKASYVSALALVHHLVFTAGIPLHKIAEYFSSLLMKDGILVFEFVPLEDSQVKRLLAARENMWEDYNSSSLKEYFAEYFSLEAEFSIPESARTIYVYKRK